MVQTRSAGIGYPSRWIVLPAARASGTSTGITLGAEPSATLLVHQVAAAFDEGLPCQPVFGKARSGVVDG